MAIAAHNIVINVDSSTPGTADQEVDGLRSVSFAPTNDLLDITDFADANARKRLQGLEDGQITISGDYEPSDSPQAYILTQQAAGGAVTFQVLWNGTNGHEVECLVQDWSIDGEVDGKVQFSATLMFNEAWTAV